MDWNAVRADFPLLSGDMAYLDNAATSQRPRQVLDAIERFYREDNANPMRGLYDLSVRATEAYEGARERVRALIGAATTEEIVFTRNATESLNLVSYSWAESHLHEGDEILVSILEHHSNLLPWQRAARNTGATLRYVDCDAQGRITEEAFRAALTEKTRLVAMTHVSNVIGRENDIRRFAALAHEVGAVFVADGAQSVPHTAVNVQDLEVDFLAFSGHKMLGPMGIGVLYGRKELLEEMPPFLYGGEMIEYVTREGATYAELPHKFEAGTVNAAGAVGLAAAIDYLQQIGFSAIEEREQELTAYTLERMWEMPYVHVLGAEEASAHHGILTFTVEGVHPHDIAAIMSEDGVCVRAGHHCAQPLLKHLGTLSTARASFMFYNTEEEAERFLKSLSGLRAKMGYPAE